MEKAQGKLSEGVSLEEDGEGEGATTDHLQMQLKAWTLQHGGSPLAAFLSFLPLC